MAKTTKCHGCQEHFQDHDECLAHLATNKACQAEIKILGKTFCFVCDRSYEKVSAYYSDFGALELIC